MNTTAEKLNRFEILYEELAALPENKIGEIIYDELVVSPRPSPKHAHAYSVMGAEILGPFQKGKGGPGGWWIIDEPEIHLDGHVVVPDLAGWKKERMPELPETAYFALSPDWVCEIISPGSARYDRVVKMELYAGFQIPFYWIVEPDGRFLQVFQLENSKWMLLTSFSENDQVKAPPFEAVSFDLGDLWA